MNRNIWILTLGIGLGIGAIASAADFDRKPASEATVDYQQKFSASLPADNGKDEEFARRGFVATLDDPVIRNDEGRVVFDPTQLDWIDGDPPATVNPSLWRQMQLHRIRGLFEVVEGVWQVRGHSAANMTIIDGDTGWVVLDPMLSTEAAERAMELVNEQLGERPVSAVVYSHSHPDHFGGVRGLNLASPDVPIVAPEHLLEETVSEYLTVGNAMTRRGSLMYGLALESGPQGKVGSGLSIGPDEGTISIIPPNDIIKQTGERRVLDGVEIEFQMVPETEAPSEVNMFLPNHKALYISEFAVCTMHNFQTPRGALVRDARRWAGYITEAIDLYVDDSEVVFSGHCWPRFGQDEVRNFLSKQRDNYKFIHDQTVRLMNEGETPFEIADQLERPRSITDEWSTRDYYATTRHNSKGVFQYYIGWWSGIPAHLNMHAPVEQGRRYVDGFGGAKKVLKLAREAMDVGDYRWSAEILNHLVFAEPENDDARALLADSYEQMGYQTESAAWRNIYLTGAAELRGLKPPPYWLASPDLANAMPLDTMLEMVATRMNPDVIGDTDLTIQVRATDLERDALISVANSVMVNRLDTTLPEADVYLEATKRQLAALLLMKRPLGELRSSGLTVSGREAKLTAFLDSIEIPATDYAIVTP